MRWTHPCSWSRKDCSADILQLATVYELYRWLAPMCELAAVTEEATCEPTESWRVELSVDLVSTVEESIKTPIKVYGLSFMQSKSKFPEIYRNMRRDV